MRLRTWFMLLLIPLVALANGCRRAPDRLGSITVTPSSGGANTVIIVQGSGWQANASIVVALRDPARGGEERTCVATAADERGRFVASFVYPADARWNSLPTVLIAAYLAGKSEAVTYPFTLNRQATAAPWLASATPQPTSTAPAATPTATPPPPTALPPSPTPVPASSTPAPPTPVSQPTAVPSPTEIVNVWQGEYYNNIDLSGSPAFTRRDAQIDYQWHEGSPGAGVRVDAFSVRWTGRWLMIAGSYRFNVTVDDGVRLWIDGHKVLEQWHETSPATYSVDARLAEGAHELRVEYYDRQGNAQIRVWWQYLGATGDSLYPQWRAEYYANRNLAGAPLRVVNDPQPTFDWGYSAPGYALPADDFSVRWTRRASFDGGIYRFFATADDGVRVWIDDNLLLIDEWHDAASGQYSADWRLAGEHTVRVEYFEHAGRAAVRVWWERQPDPTATPTHTPPRISDWKGEYFNNTSLSGQPDLVRNDVSIDFIWGDGSPSTNIRRDDFSVRWTRTLIFPAGLYRLTVLVDDGARLWVDDQLLIDQWHEAPQTVYSAQVYLSGEHRLRLEYLERGGYAVVQFGWQYLATPAPTRSLTPTPTLTPSRASTPTLTVTPTHTPSRTSTLTRTPSRTSAPALTVTQARTASATPSLMPSRTPTAGPSPTVTSTPVSWGDPLAARYFPLSGLEGGAYEAHVRQLTGEVQKWRSLPQPPYFTFNLHTNDDQVYAIEGVPEGAIMASLLSQTPALTPGRPGLDRPEVAGGQRVSPLIEGLAPRNGSRVTVTAVLTGTRLIAERLDVQIGNGWRTWYHRGLLAEDELGPEAIALYGGLEVWIRTNLGSARTLAAIDLGTALDGFPDQPALLAGELNNEGRIEQPRVYIRTAGGYQCLFAAEPVPGPLPPRLKRWLPDWAARALDDLLG